MASKLIKVRHGSCNISPVAFSGFCGKWMSSHFAVPTDLKSWWGDIGCLSLSPPQVIKWAQNRNTYIPEITVNFVFVLFGISRFHSQTNWSQRTTDIHFSGRKNCLWCTHVHVRRTLIIQKKLNDNRSSKVFLAQGANICQYRRCGRYPLHNKVEQSFSAEWDNPEGGTQNKCRNKESVRVHKWRNNFRSVSSGRKGSKVNGLPAFLILWFRTERPLGVGEALTTKSYGLQGGLWKIRAGNAFLTPQWHCVQQWKTMPWVTLDFLTGQFFARRVKIPNCHLSKIPHVTFWKLSFWSWCFL